MKKKCRICGKEFESCHTAYRSKNLFRWQDIACCPEHGEQFFKMIADEEAAESARKITNSANIVINHSDQTDGIAKNDVTDDAQPKKRSAKKKKTEVDTHLAAE